MEALGLILYFGGFIVAAAMALQTPTDADNQETEREIWKRS